MSSTGYQSYGISIASGTSSGGTFASPLAELEDITPPALAVDDIEISNNSSGTLTTGRPVKEYLPGWVEGGEVPAKLIYQPSVQSALMAQIGVPLFWKITFPDKGALTNNSTLVFPGYLKTLGQATPLKDKMEVDATFKVTGVPVFTVAS